MQVQETQKKTQDVCFNPNVIIATTIGTELLDWVQVPCTKQIWTARSVGPNLCSGFIIPHCRKEQIETDHLKPRGDPTTSTLNRSMTSHVVESDESNINVTSC